MYACGNYILRSTWFHNIITGPTWWWHGKVVDVSSSINFLFFYSKEGKWGRVPPWLFRPYSTKLYSTSLCGINISMWAEPAVPIGQPIVNDSSWIFLAPSPPGICVNLSKSAKIPPHHAFGHGIAMELILLTTTLCSERRTPERHDHVEVSGGNKRKVLREEDQELWLLSAGFRCWWYDGCTGDSHTQILW